MLWPRCGDSGSTKQPRQYRSHVIAAIETAATAAADHTHIKGCRNRLLTAADKAANRIKSRTRARVEHPIGTIKHVFGFRKVRYRGIAKNANRLCMTSALANLFQLRHDLPRAVGWCVHEGAKLPGPRKLATIGDHPAHQADTAATGKIRAAAIEVARRLIRPSITLCGEDITTLG